MRRVRMGFPASAMALPMPASLAERRKAAAPLALLLIGWGLALGPLLHALIGHGLPVLTTAADTTWVRHGPERSGPPARPHGHSHPVDSTDHFQLSIHPVVPPVTAPMLVVRAESSGEVPQQEPTLARRWSPAVPEGP
jgi:hypothetical protein